MLIRMKASGCVEDVFDYVGELLCRNGLAEPYVAVLHAEEQDGPAATVGIEVAMLEPRMEMAVIKYERGPRSRRG